MTDQIPCLTPETVKPAMRVRVLDPRATHQIGMVTASTINKRQAWVIPEGAANGLPELWPLRVLQPLPEPEQPEILGGRFRLPKGYPYVTKTPDSNPNLR